MLNPRLLLIALLALPVYSTVMDKATDTLKIGNRTVLNAWQSSIYEHLFCFFGRSASVEDELAKSHLSYGFVHSANKDKADNGYHWFVVLLKSTVYITAVSIAGRNDTDARVYNRAAGIEVWTSDEVVDFTSVDSHCWPQKMKISGRFADTLNQWKMCGVTRARLQNVVRGEVLTVYCTAQVKMLLLRMYVANRSTPLDDVLSFVYLRLTIGHPPTVVDTTTKATTTQTVCTTTTQLRTSTSAFKYVQEHAGLRTGLCIAVLCSAIMLFILMLAIILYSYKAKPKRNFTPVSVQTQGVQCRQVLDSETTYINSVDDSKLTASEPTSTSFNDADAYADAGDYEDVWIGQK